MAEKTVPAEPLAIAGVPNLDQMSKEELQKLVNLYGSALAAVCLCNNLDTFFVPHLQLPPGVLMHSWTPMGLGIAYIRNDQMRSNPDAKLN